MTDSGSRWREGLVCLMLAVAVLATFWPALRCGFVYYDDPVYVGSNTHVQQGLSWHGLKWALTTGEASNWHPLTWLSHSLDCQLYGLNPAGHHLTSLLLHLVNVVLLFLLLNRLTGVLWASAWVAAVFALHPMRVESVVWVAERKDVLSTFFWMLAVGAYVRYVNPPSPRLRRTGIFYGLSLLFFALGLMSKPMLVTLPFVLLLLDFWPLRRLEFGPKFSWRPVAEKIPFFVLAAGSCVVTYLVQNRTGAMASLDQFPLGIRLANIPVVYGRYIGKSFWPSGLAVFYPHRPLGFLEVGGTACLLAAVSVLAARRWRAQPYLAVGWFWFLGMLVPTIGVVQVGFQAMADRYSYVPSVGLWIMVAWWVREWAGGRPFPRALAALAGGAALIACVILTSRQVTFWRDSRTLFMRAMHVTDQNYLACYNLGCYARDQGDYREAIMYFTQALSTEKDDALWISHARAHNNLGYAYLHEGQISNAVANFEKALEIEPKYPEAYYNLGRAFLANHQPDVAVDCFQRALALDPGVAEIRRKLADAASELRRLQAEKGGSHP